ncbi:hypothetical protein N9H60_03580 [Flavimaricola sp.]|nr:hypothetical protein [Flavimaricola sp.]MDA9020238.1 hypothetical protein [Flavimaricola sp.]
MSRTPAKFTQADISRALRAVNKCDIDAEVILEPDGRIRIAPSDERTGPQMNTDFDIRL